MKTYADILEKSGLHDAVERIVQRFPHLQIVARTDARTFALNACRLVMVPGVSLREYGKLGAIADSDR